MNFQAAASMMSPPMSPARKNAKDPDKPKVLDLDLPWKKPICPHIHAKHWKNIFSSWSPSSYLLTFPFHFGRFLFCFPFLTSHIASWTEAESDWDSASFSTSILFSVFSCNSNSPFPPPWPQSCRCGSNHFFCRFFIFFSVTITTTITNTITSYLDHSD